MNQELCLNDIDMVRLRMQAGMLMNCGFLRIDDFDLTNNMCFYHVRIECQNAQEKIKGHIQNMNADIQIPVTILLMCEIVELTMCVANIKSNEQQDQNLTKLCVLLERCRRWIDSRTWIIPRPEDFLVLTQDDLAHAVLFIKQFAPDRLPPLDKGLNIKINFEYVEFVRATIQDKYMLTDAMLGYAFELSCVKSSQLREEERPWRRFYMIPGDQSEREDYSSSSDQEYLPERENYSCCYVDLKAIVRITAIILAIFVVLGSCMFLYLTYCVKLPELAYVAIWLLHGHGLGVFATSIIICSALLFLVLYQTIKFCRDSYLYFDSGRACFPNLSNTQENLLNHEAARDFQNQRAY